MTHAKEAQEMIDDMGGLTPRDLATPPALKPSGDAGEVVKRLRTPHTLDIRDIVQVRALLDTVAVERTDAADLIERLNARCEKWAAGMSGELDEHARTKARATTLERQLATAREALENIRELNFSGADENGNQWANSDLIDQEIIAALAALTPGVSDAE